MHFVGMQALSVPGALQWNLACALWPCSAAWPWGRRPWKLPAAAAAPGLWFAPILLTLAICFMHFTAMGAVSVAYDPTAIVVPSLVDDDTMALAVAGVAMLIMLSAFGAAFVNGMAQSEVQEELRRQRDDLQQRKEELRKQNVLFDMALSNMAHGLCLLDAQQNLVVCNRRYAEIYTIPPELTKPGTPLADLLAHRFASGVQLPSDAQAYMHERLGALHGAAIRIDRLSDGRIIQATRRPMQSGALVAIHEDITEREQLAAQLKRQNLLLQQREEQLKSRNADLDAALANMTHGIAMFDAEDGWSSPIAAMRRCMGWRRRPSNPA